MNPDRLQTVLTRTTATGSDIYALAEAGESDDPKCPTAEFLKTLSRKKPVLSKHLLNNLKNTAKDGPTSNETKFRYLKGYDGIVEFKAKASGAGGARLFGFFDGERVILCTHGAEKANDGEMRQEYEKANRMRKAYLANKKSNGPLPILP